MIGSNFNIEYEKSEAEARMKRQLELTSQEHTAAAANLSAGSHKALLGAVEKLLSDQREVILKRAEDMIAQHVRDIAKEVVAHSRNAPHFPTTPDNNRAATRASSTPQQRPTPGGPRAAEGVPAEEAALHVPTSAAGGDGGNGAIASQESRDTAAAGAPAASAHDVT